jgi:hypothetical protein
MMPKSPSSIDDNEVLICETCLNFFSNRAEFEEHSYRAGHGDNSVLLRAVSTIKTEDKVIVMFEIPQ